MKKNSIVPTEPALGIDQTVGKVRIQVQQASAIEAELTLCMEAVSKSIQSLEQAQQITQDSLQLEVCV
jgi:hypothetical protein